MKTLLFFVLIILFLSAILLERAARSITPKEFKRRARADYDPIATRLHKMTAYGQSLELFLWVTAAGSLSALVIIAARSSLWSAVIIIVVATWLLWTKKPLKSYGNLAWKLAGLLAPLVSWVLSYLQPILGRFGGLRLAPRHTGAYEKEDLLEILTAQNRQHDNRISESDLKLAFHTLQFGDKSVGKIMKPRKAVKWVSEDEPISPAVMDELHASGFSSFPVVKDASKKTPSPEVVGTLYLNDLIDRPAGGKVRDVTHRDVYFINESANLREALAAFSKTHHHLLIVVNNFEEVVGVLTFELLVEQILGEKIANEFDNYGNKRAVASKDSASEESEPEPKKPHKK